MTTIETLLRKIYYDASHHASFSTEEKLFQAALKEDATVTRQDVRNFLLNQYTYTLHKAGRKHFLRNQVIVPGPEEQLQADLVDMQEFVQANDGYRYLLTAIDVFSRKAFVVPLKDKRAKSIVNAFKTVLKTISPLKIQTDRGTEFKNSSVESSLEKENIKLFYTFDEEIKCAVVERFNRTLKGKMFKYFTATGKRRYIDALPSLVASYNNSVHRSIGMRPNDVDRTNSPIVFEKLYGKKDRRSLLTRNPVEKVTFSVGDKVRIRYHLSQMDKAYYPNYTDQQFTITRINRSYPRITYVIKDWQDNIVGGKFYREELTPVGEDAPYRVEKILKRDNKTKRVLVKWLNYPAEAASWEPEAALKHPL